MPAEDSDSVNVTHTSHQVTMETSHENNRITPEQARQLDRELMEYMLKSTMEPREAGNFEDLLDFSKKGMDVAEQLLEIGGIFSNADWKKMMVHLTDVFTWGKAIYGIITLFTGGGDNGGVQEKLSEILDKLENIEDAIRQGFKDLMAHNDSSYFRNNIATPAQTLFDRMKRCQRTLTDTTVTDFLDDCYKSPPGNLLTAMFKFLDNPGSGLWTQLEASKFGYGKYKEWTNVLNHTAAQLTIVNMFYYGMRLAKEGKSDDEKERFEKGEQKEMIFQLNRIHELLDKMEFERVKSFINKGPAKDVLRNVAEKARDGVGNPLSDWGLNSFVSKMNEMWKEANGKMVPFTIIAWRGRMNYNGEYCDRMARRADYFIYNPGNIVIVDNLYAARKEEERGYERWGKSFDNLNVALIQPVDKTMLDRHDSAKNNQESNKIFDYMNKRLTTQCDMLDWRWLQRFFNEVNEMKQKPLLILYNIKEVVYCSNESPRVANGTEERDQYAFTGTEGMTLAPKCYTLKQANGWDNRTGQVFLFVIYQGAEK